MNLAVGWCQFRCRYTLPRSARDRWRCCLIVPECCRELKSRGYACWCVWFNRVTTKKKEITHASQCAVALPWADPEALRVWPPWYVCAFLRLIILLSLLCSVPGGRSSLRDACCQHQTATRCFQVKTDSGEPSSCCILSCVCQSCGPEMPKHIKKTDNDQSTQPTLQSPGQSFVWKEQIWEHGVFNLPGITLSFRKS